MTGKPTVAYKHEPVGDYRGTPTDSTFKYPGMNINVEDLSFENALARMTVPDDPATLDAVAQIFEGAIGLSWTLTEPWWLNHHFGNPPSAGGETSAPYTYSWSTAFGAAQSSRWYFGLDYLSGTVERVVKGAVFPDVQVDFSMGDEVTINATGFYGDETKNTSVSPGTIHGKDSSPMVFHGANFEIPNSSKLAKVESATLDLSTNIRAQRDLSRKPVDAVLGRPEPTLDLDKVVTSTSQLNLAYGNSNAPVTGDLDGAANGTVRFQAGSSSPPALEFQLSGVTPNQYGWDQYPNPDEDTLESLSYFVNDLTAVAESDESSAL